MDNAEQLDQIYQRIGEFVVVFQFAEARVREIGWLLLDPDRKNWPPTALRNLTNRDLLTRVQEIYSARVSSFPGNGADDYCRSFEFVIKEAHRARQLRNRLLHSAFVELKAGREVFGLVRVDPKLVLDEDGAQTIDSEHLADAGLAERIAGLAPLILALNFHYTQLIHWTPFEPPPVLNGCGLMFHVDGLPFTAVSPDSQDLG